MLTKIAPNSVVSAYRSTGLNVTGGSLLKAFGVPKGQSVQLDVTSQYLVFSPGDILTVSVASIEAMNAVGADISVSISVCERQ